VAHPGGRCKEGGRRKRRRWSVRLVEAAVRLAEVAEWQADKLRATRHGRMAAAAERSSPVEESHGLWFQNGELGQLYSVGPVKSGYFLYLHIS
jgi:hypothetical protein